MQIIAEIGKNFVVTEQPEPLETLLWRAKQLIIAASNAGADVVKFQVHNVEDEIHPGSEIISPHFRTDRYEWVKRNTYPAEFWQEIKRYCDSLGIEFLATPMSRAAAQLLNEEVGVERWKIGSGDILDFVMLDYIRDTGRPVIISSGMSLLDEVRQSYHFLKEKTPDVSILHCVSQYPCALEDLNLATISVLKREFDAPIGFSDHSIGIEGALMAASLGAEIIEKHLTLDRHSYGPDHKVSILPNELARMIKYLQVGEAIEATPEALGIDTKGIMHEELPFRKAFRKGLYAAQDMKSGDMIEPDMLIALRPALTGALSSEHYPEFLGKTVKRPISKFEPINYASVT